MQIGDETTRFCRSNNHVLSQTAVTAVRWTVIINCRKFNLIMIDRPGPSEPQIRSPKSLVPFRVARSSPERRSSSISNYGSSGWHEISTIRRPSTCNGGCIHDGFNNLESGHGCVVREDCST